ncbi:hypothetical protein RchiOBHm_Chr5g0080341 [Rosa chinensis]|uniref:Uncharacterized protein n=1 Tax=Rosa chinensis TaxID=74649 RepID=A0A2P6QMR9_ROSCH|nr:hypothetical protein RchiOBHm_Chr5g0080341 [Rosa chinensis]
MQTCIHKVLWVLCQKLSALNLVICPFLSNEFMSIMCKSASSIHVGAADGVSQHSSENDSVVASFPSAASAPELHSVESSDAVKVDETSFMIVGWNLECPHSHHLHLL